MTRAKYFPVQFDKTQSTSIYYMNTECWKCWQFFFNLNRLQKKGTWGTFSKEILPYKHFPFFQVKTRIKFIEKISLFSSFLFALKFDQLKSINIWKSKLKISGKIILYKPCYNCKICNSVNVLYELFFPLQYAMLVPAVVLFAFGILIYFCLIPSPDEIGEYKHLYKVVSHIEVTFIFWSDKIISSKYS